MAAAQDPVIQTKKLTKAFKLGVRRRTIKALRGITFAVRQGEIFGFLGPNGAGKTTTIKIIVGLLRPTEGDCLLMGRPAGDIEARRHIGYLPESPYFYDHLLPDEFMDLCGRLRGLGGKDRRRRGTELLERVGLGRARDRPLRKFSKGMLQRIGLAQTLIGDPDLLILDEPMTGLDPVGRKEVRDLIVDLRRKGKTVFFSSHILSDVETLCDRVAIIHEGKVVDEGSLADLLEAEGLFVDIELKGATDELADSLVELTEEVHHEGEVLRASVKGEAATGKVLRLALDAGVAVHSVVPRRETLENLFVRRVLGTGKSQDKES